MKILTNSRKKYKLLSMKTLSNSFTFLSFLLLISISIIIQSAYAEQNFRCNMIPSKTFCKAELNWYLHICGKSKMICHNVLEAQVSLYQKLNALIVKVKHPDGSIKPYRLNYPPDDLHKYLGGKISEAEESYFNRILGEQVRYFGHITRRNRDTVRKALQDNIWIQQNIPTGSSVIDIADNGFVFSEKTKLSFSDMKDGYMIDTAYKAGTLGEILQSVQYRKEKHNTSCSYINHPVYRKHLVEEHAYIHITKYEHTHILNCFTQKSCVFKDDKLIRKTQLCKWRSSQYVDKCPKDCLEGISNDFDKHFKKITQCEEAQIELISDNSTSNKKCAVLYGCSLKENKHKVIGTCPALSNGMCPTVKECVQQVQANSKNNNKLNKKFNKIQM